MYKLILLGFALLFGLLFMLIPHNTEPKDWFLFYDGIKLTAQWYWYYIFEHLSIITLSYVIAAEARKYRFEILLFFWIQVFQLVDFIFTYNSTWFHVGFVPISMNMISVTVYGLALIRRIIEDEQ